MVIYPGLCSNATTTICSDMCVVTFTSDVCTFHFLLSFEFTDSNACFISVILLFSRVIALADHASIEFLLFSH